jgi:hypothetical protein
VIANEPEDADIGQYLNYATTTTDNIHLRCVAARPRLHVWTGTPCAQVLWRSVQAPRGAQVGHRPRQPVLFPARRRAVGALTIEVCCSEA